MMVLLGLMGVAVVSMIFLPDSDVDPPESDNGFSDEPVFPERQIHDDDALTELDPADLLQEPAANSDAFRDEIGAVDTILGTDDHEIIFGDDDDNIIRAFGGSDYVDGEGGDDIIYGGDGDDTLHGGPGDDILYGEEGNDRLYGHTGDDILYAGSGNNVLNGGGGNDILYGGSGNDMLHGSLGDDTLFAGGGNNVLHGGAGDDLLVGINDGPAMKDYLNGGAGDDTLIGGAYDHLNGGTGADTFILSANEAAVAAVHVEDFDDREDSLVILYDTDAPVPDLSTLKDGADLLLMANGLHVATLAGVSEIDLSTIRLIAR